MCQIKPATQEQLNTLRTPDALAALEVLKQTGWLAADVQSLDKFFSDDRSHPAKESLLEEARNGGQLALIQFAVLFSFTALAVIISSHQSTLTPYVFVLWGSLGVCAGLLAASYPGRVFGKRRMRA